MVTSNEKTRNVLFVFAQCESAIFCFRCTNKCLCTNGLERRLIEKLNFDKENVLPI